MEKRFVLTALGVLAIVGQAMALNQLENCDFQLPGVETWVFNGEGGQPDIPGWATDTQPECSGVFMPSDYGIGGKLYGDFTAILMDGDPAAWNLSSNIIAAHTSYMVTMEAIDVGYYVGGCIPSNLKVKMYYNNEGVRSEIVSQIITLGTSWENYSVSFNADNYPLAAGKQLGIELQNVSLGYMDSFAGVDNVVLTPEPATLLLVGLGGLVLRKRRA